MTELEKAAVEEFKKLGSTSYLEIFKAGANWQYEQFEKERLKHCDELTEEQAQIESDFVVQHLKKCNRKPTFIDAIEYGRKAAFKEAAEWLEDELYAEKVNTLYPPMSIVISKSYESVDAFIQGFQKINQKKE